MTRQLSQPSFVNGFARSPGESVRPDLWPNHAWMPTFGVQGPQLIGGLMVFDVAGGQYGLGTPAAASDTVDALLPSWSVDKYGYCLISNESGGHGGGIKCGASPFTGLTAMTFEVLYKPSTAENSGMIAEDGTVFYQNTFYLHQNTNKFDFLTRTTDATNSLVSSAATVVAGKWYHIFCTWSGVDGFNRIWVNNVEAVSAEPDESLTLRATVNAELCLFGRPDTSSRIASYEVLNGAKIAFWRAYKRQLQASEIYALTADPFLSFRRKRSFAAMGGAAASGVVIFRRRRSG